MDSPIPGDEEGNGRRILVVDDDPDTREFLGEALRALGHRHVTLAGEGFSALTHLEEGLAREEPFGLVLTDLRMPGMDGLTLLRWIRGHADLGPTPCAAMSGTGRGDVRAVLAALGVPAFLQKPFELKDLAGAIGEALEETKSAGAPTPLA